MSDDFILQKLTEYLSAQGYPEDSMLLNYKADKYRADLVIVDEKTQTPLQFFLLKNKTAKSSQNKSKRQIRLHTDETEKINPDFSGYLVMPKEQEPFFEIIDPSTDKPVRISDLNYKNLVQKGKNAKETLINSNKSRAVGNLKWATVLLISLICVILILDIFNVIEVTGYRLYMVLIIVILALLPYYETIKIANFELTQKNKQKENQVKD